MDKYVIMTDSACDLPEEYIKSHNLDVLNLMYNLEGTLYGGENQLEIKDFYNRMRAGSMPTTMAVNPEEVKTAMRRHLEQDEDVLYLAFSSDSAPAVRTRALRRRICGRNFPDGRSQSSILSVLPWDRGFSCTGP